MVSSSPRRGPTRGMANRRGGETKASAWLSAERAETERARADKEAEGAPRVATLPRSQLLGPVPGVAAPSFVSYPLPYGNQFCAAMTWPDGRYRQIGVFKTAAQAQAWIDTKSAGWLAAQ
jgi:hypothetical protein